MKKVRTLCLTFTALFFLSSCGPTMMTKKEAFPKMYESQPVSILVLPPINETTAADAKEYYGTTIAEPLTCEGYYVFPIEVTSDILRAEGLYDTELLLAAPAQKFKEYFGADSVLYIKILKWDTTYYVIGGKVTVTVDFLLRSTTTGENLWQYNGTMIVDTTGSDYGLPGWAGLIAKVVSTAIKTAATDYVPAARTANYMTLTSMPFGHYHPSCNKDMDDKVVLKDKVVQESR